MKRKPKILRIANGYGNVDIRAGVPKRYTHVPGARLGQLCTSMGISFAPAVVGFSGCDRYGWKPVKDGVVVSSLSAKKLRTAVAEREEKNAPAREKARQYRARNKQEVEAQHIDRCCRLGVDPDSRNGHWLKKGQVTDLHAQFIAFQTTYRHEFTNYDDVIQQYMEQARQEADGLHGYERRELFDDYRRTAREMAKERQPPATSWDEYLGRYGFPYPEMAKKVAGVLRSPREAHPVWFCEAVFACVWADEDPKGYSDVVAHIAVWRDARREF